jgi:hypothetical protein
MPPKYIFITLETKLTKKRLGTVQLFAVRGQKSLPHKEINNQSDILAHMIIGKVPKSGMEINGQTVSGLGRKGCDTYI